MKQRTVYLAIATLLAIASQPAFAQEGAQVLFTSGSLNVIDANGIQRAAKQGDTLAAGERIVTPPGVMAQIKLPDGAMVSARPDSEMRIQQMGMGAATTVLQLNQGNVRVLNTDTPTGIAAKPINVVTPVSTLQLGRGDGESIHVKTSNAALSGTFNRVQTGTGVVATPNGNLALQSQQTARVAGVGSAPVAVSELPKALAQVAAVAPAARAPTGAGATGAATTNPGTAQGAAVAPTARTPTGAGLATGAATINLGTSQLVTPSGGVNATNNTVTRIAAANPNTSIRPPSPPSPPTGLGGSNPIGGGALGIRGGGSGTNTVISQITNNAVRQVTAPKPPPVCRTITRPNGQRSQICS